MNLQLKGKKLVQIGPKSRKLGFIVQRLILGKLPNMTKFSDFLIQYLTNNLLKIFLI